MHVQFIFGILFLTACTAEKKVENNVAPEFTNLWLEPTDGITTSTQLYCVANATDANDDQILLDYVWTNSAGEIVSDTWDFMLSPNLVQPTEQLTCTATISDEDFTVEQSISVTVENTAPEIVSMTMTPNDIVNDSLLICVIETIDSDLETLSISYSWMQGTTELGTAQTLQLSSDILVGSDPISCTVTVEDGYGGTATQSIETDISNRVPVIGSVTLSPESPFETDTLLCETTEVIDSDGDNVIVSYEWSINGILHTETTNMLEGVFTVDDIIACSATPSDGFGSGTTVSAEATIDNGLPSIDTLTLSATTVTTDTSISVITVTSNLESNQTITVEYEWLVVDSSGTDNIIQTGTTETLDSTVFVSGQTIYVIATPNDGLEDGVSVTSDMIMVDNSPPTDLLASVVSDNNFYNDSTLTCSASASDLDVNDGVDTLSYTYTWSTGDTGDTLVLDGSLAPNTSVDCTVEATDGADTISIGVINTLANRAPSVSVTVSTGVTAETTSVFCDATATDQDATVPTLSYMWTVNGISVSEASDTLSGPFVFGDTLECIVEADDGIDTDTANTFTTVGNTAPIVDSFSVGPTSAYTDSTLTVATILSDVDAAQSGNLTATYEWHVVAPSGNDTMLAGQVDAFLSNTTLNEFFMKGDGVYVIATPNDGVDNGISVTSNSVGILNTTPSAPTVSVSSTPNTPPVEGEDDLICSIDTPSSDLDGDALTYSYVWTDTNGSIVQMTTDVLDLSDNVDGINTVAGDWNCTVTANDGEDNSLSAEDTITVDSAFVSIFVYGTIAGQDGWSGMTNSGAQIDSFPTGTMISGDSDDRGDSIVGVGLPETGSIFNGNQAWWFRRGYDSPGSGTPYTPNLTPNTTDDDEDGVADQGFHYEISFKAADENGDGSRMGVITGDAAGTDRASNYLEIYNDTGNLYIRSYANGSYNTLVDNLDTSVWHTIEATMYRDGVLDYWTYSVDGVEVTTAEIGYFCDFRVANGFSYVESTRLKFQPRHSNYDANFQGFFFDDIVSQTLDSNTGIVIESYSTGFE